MMLSAGILALVSAFIGAFGFGMLLHAPARALPVGAALGAAGYGLYWALPLLGCPDALSMFLGAFLAAALSQLAARKMQMISTIFVTIAILPLVPGLGLYRAMSAWGQGLTEQGSQVAVESMTLVLMIALGVAVGAALFAPRRRSPRKGCPKANG